MNQSTLFKMWQLIIEHDGRKNMANDFAGEELESAVEAIIASTVIEPIDVHHCIVTLDRTMTDLIVQKNGLIVSRICQEEKWSSRKTSQSNAWSKFLNGVWTTIKRIDASILAAKRARKDTI